MLALWSLAGRRQTQFEQASPLSHDQQAFFHFTVRQLMALKLHANAENQRYGSLHAEPGAFDQDICRRRVMPQPAAPSAAVPPVQETELRTKMSL
jgi:hypothetical protein